MTILSVSQNPINSSVKNLHSHAIASLVFMHLASILKEFYIRFVWRILSEFDDVGEEIYYVIICNLSPIFYSSLNPRNYCVKRLHSHAIVSLVFMDFGFNIEVVLYKICTIYILWVWGCFDIHILCITIYLISIISVGRNPRNSSVKGLHSHALELIVCMYLASTLKELYIIFIWRNLSDV